MSALVIYGAGGHGKVVLDLGRQTGRYDQICFIDDEPAKVGQTFCECPILRENDAFDAPVDAQLIIAIGSNHRRAERFLRAQASRRSIVTLTHPTAVLDPSSTIGTGSVVMAGAILNACVRVGENCIVNTGAILEHDCGIGDHCHISPRATLGGEVVVGPYAHIGIGAIILPRMSIGEGAVVGAGAVVVRPVAPFTTVVGVPAKLISRTSKGNS
jgi:sugar O-acyltransferase (sialic acid O-acetyltransferase NeuD family)